jgi:hypothetical protein
MENEAFDGEDMMESEATKDTGGPEASGLHAEISRREMKEWVWMYGNGKQGCRRFQLCKSSIHTVMRLRCEILYRAIKYIRRSEIHELDG